MKLIKALLPVLFIITLSACTIVDGGAIVTGKTRPPISSDNVQIYSKEPKNYEEVAILSASAGHDFKSNSALTASTVERLKTEAAKLGANGVLLTTIDERDAVQTTSSFGALNAHANNGRHLYATGNSFGVNRGDTYTRMKGLAIYVP